MMNPYMRGGMPGGGMPGGMGGQMVGGIGGGMPGMGMSPAQLGIMQGMGMAPGGMPGGMMGGGMPQPQPRPMPQGAQMQMPQGPINPGGGGQGRPGELVPPPQAQGPSPTKELGTNVEELAAMARQLRGATQREGAVMEQAAAANPERFQGPTPGGQPLDAAMMQRGRMMQDNPMRGAFAQRFNPQMR